MDINDTNDKVEVEVEAVLKSREENSNESVSKPPNDENIMDTLIDDSTDNNSYVDSDDNDPEFQSSLLSLKKKYKGRGSTPKSLNLPKINDLGSTPKSLNLPKINERVRLMSEKYSRRKSQSSSRSNVDSRSSTNPVADYDDDGIGSSKKRQLPSLSTEEPRREFEFNFSSSDEESTKRNSRRKSSGLFSDDEGFDNFNFSDEEKNTKGRSFVKPDGFILNYERRSSLDDEFSITSNRFHKKFKSNSLNYLSDHAEESADEDYVPAVSINDKEDKIKEKPNKKESFYLATDDDELGEVLKPKDDENTSHDDNLLKSVSTKKASESLMDIDGTSGKLDEESLLGDNLDDYVAVDKPTYSPKKKQQPRQIIIHEESSNITELQPPFQPGSSPLKNGRRYLAINWLGSIHAVDNTTYHSVNVEYNNKTNYRGYNFRDDVGYTMACLGAHGVLFAVESDTENASILYYKPNNSWGPKGEWMTTLPKGEDIIAIALSDQLIAIATSKNYLRFFTLFGFQHYIFAFPSIVCMAAYNNLLLIAYHLSVAYKGSQNFGYVLYDTRDRGDIQKDVLPISKGSTLKWLGFSEEGLPVMFDSKGVLYILHDHRIYKQARWVPVLDTANIVKEPTKSDKSKLSEKNSDVIDVIDEDKVEKGDEKDGEKDEEKEIEEKEKEKEKEWLYWPVAVMESKLMCFILKYGEDVPRYPRPAYDEVSWQIPLLQLDKESGRCEERWIRESIISSFQCQEFKAKNELNQEKMIQLKKKERSTNKIIIELIGMAVSEEKYERALELAKLLNSIKLLDSALAITEFYRVTSLAEKINKLKSELLKEKSRKQALKEKEREKETNRTYLRPSTKRSTSTYVSDFNHDYNNSTNLGGPSQYEDTLTSSLKRSVKDMNDGKRQEVDDDSPKPKKSISSFFDLPKKSKSGGSNTNPFIVNDSKSDTNKRRRAPRKQIKGKNNKNGDKHPQDQENNKGHSYEKEQHESETYLVNNEKPELGASETNIDIETSKENVKINMEVSDVNIEINEESIVEESSTMDIDIEKEAVGCFD